MDLKALCKGVSVLLQEGERKAHNQVDSWSPTWGRNTGLEFLTLTPPYSWTCLFPWMNLRRAGFFFIKWETARFGRACWRHIVNRCWAIFFWCTSGSVVLLLCLMECCQCTLDLICNALGPRALHSFADVLVSWCFFFLFQLPGWNPVDCHDLPAALHLPFHLSATHCSLELPQYVFNNMIQALPNPQPLSWVSPPPVSSPHCSLLFSLLISLLSLPCFFS